MFLQQGAPRGPIDPAQAQGPATIVECLEPRPPRVLAVALLDTIAYARRWLGAQEIPLRKVVRVLWWEAGLLIALSCAVIWLGGRTPGWTVVSAPAFLVLIALMMSWSRRTWRELRKLAPALDAIVTDPAERARIAGRLHRRLRWPLQLVVVLLGIIVGLVIGVLAAEATGSAPDRDLSFVVLDGVTFGLGANVLFWLVMVVAWFGCLSRLESIDLGRAPESNAAIRGCTKLVRAVRRRLALGLVFAQIPLVIVSVKAEGSLLPIIASAAVMVFFVVFSFGLVVCRRVFLRRILETDMHRTVEQITRWYDERARTTPEEEQIEVYDHYLTVKERVLSSPFANGGGSKTWLDVVATLGPLLLGLLSLVLGVMGLDTGG